MEKALKIYSASAGSGKTYNLVLMYLKLILGDEHQSTPFASIMAMTFTNKAASEMKTRIIEALNLLGNFNSEDPKALAYSAEIAALLKLSETEVQKRARKNLKQILHEYEHFNVLTIDKFNLRLIRSFSRDLNINNDFQTTTNEKDVLGEIVDQLFAEINQPNFEKLTEIALKYSKENIDEEVKWDFKADLKALAEILIKEQNQTAIAEMMEQDFSVKRYDLLKNELNQLVKNLQAEAKNLHDLYFSFDSSQFPGASRTNDAFSKLISDKLFASEYDVFFSPTVYGYFSEDGAKKALPEALKQAGLKFSAQYEEQISRYHELRLFRNNFFNIAILQLIAKELDEYKKSDNVVLISEFNKLISELLKNEDAPYIYERIGNRYKHFLLDEFQDTSRLQWTNLIPLVHESLSYRHQNLIVGDPKQSIYRFKNGLAEQFVALPRIYNPEKDPVIALKSKYFEEAGEVIPLEDNWRSKSEIVEFNNLFFEAFSQQEGALLEEFYKDIRQNPKGENGGYISIESEVNAANYTAEDEEIEDVSTGELGFLLGWINECLEAGYDKGDICILGYTSKSCNQWARFLSNQGHKVVSADSLLLGSDPSVKLIIAYINWRINPIGELEARRFSEIYYDLKTKHALREVKQHWKTITYKEKEVLIFDATGFIISEFGSEQAFFFEFENLYQLLQKFYLLVSFKELNNAYLHQFADYVYQFDLNFGPDLSLFIENFKNEGYKIPVQIPENREAIKVMTGHKSKGLEFPIVMIPEMKWNILMGRGKYLIQNKDQFYYTNISKKSKLQVIRSYYEREYSQALLDKINLNYVLFTRAKDRLYVMNRSSRGKSDVRYEFKLHQVLQLLPGIEHEGDKLILRLGTKTPKKAESISNQTSKVFHPKFIADNLWFPDISLQDRELIDDQGISEQQRFGNQFHELLAKVNKSDEIQTQARSLLLKGKIEQQFFEQICADMQRLFALPFYQTLFENATKILREQAILISENESKRPDLIVCKESETLILDYKTGLESPKHRKQVQLYCQTLREMGYPEVKGFLFYTGRLEVVGV